MSLLEDDWNYPVVNSDLDADDPIVDTGTEYMFQMATIAFHTLHGTQTVVLDETVEYNGETFEAGSYEFEVGGRYWTDFDRRHQSRVQLETWHGAVLLPPSSPSSASVRSQAARCRWASAWQRSWEPWIHVHADRSWPGLGHAQQGRDRGT